MKTEQNIFDNLCKGLRDLEYYDNPAKIAAVIIYENSLSAEMEDKLSEKDIDTLMDYFNSLSGLKKELVIKQALNKIKEKYENSEDPTAYKFTTLQGNESNVFKHSATSLKL